MSQTVHVKKLKMFIFAVIVFRKVFFFSIEIYKMFFIFQKYARCLYFFKNCLEI